MFFVAIGAFALGVCIRSYILVPAAVSAFIAVCGFVFLIFYLLTDRRVFSLVGLCVLFLFGGVLRMGFVPEEMPIEFRSLIGSWVRMEGSVVADPDVRQTTQRVTVEVSREGKTMRLLVVAPLRQQVTYGEQVRIIGKFAAPMPFNTDGGRVFLYDRYLSKDAVFAIVQPGEIQLLGPAKGYGVHFIGLLYSIAHTFSRALSKALPEPEAGLAVGIIVGGKQGLGPELLAAFTAAGVVQIVVLSGYNVMIVAEFIFRTLSFLPRKVAYAASAVGIILFVIAAGSGSSAVRAALMACLALFARATNRTYDVLRALCIVVFAMLLWNPTLLAYDPGFELSCLATFGLILASPSIERRLLFIHRVPIRDAIATTLAAEIFILPLLLWQTGNLSLVSVPANVVLSFLVPAAMAFSAFAGGMGIIIPPMAIFFGMPARVVLFVIIWIARFAASLPFAQVTIPAFPFWIVVAAYTVIAYLLWKEQKTLPAEAGKVFRYIDITEPSGTVPHKPTS